MFTMLHSEIIGFQGILSRSTQIAKLNIHSSNIGKAHLEIHLARTSAAILGKDKLQTLSINYSNVQQTLRGDKVSN